MIKNNINLQALRGQYRLVSFNQKNIYISSRIPYFTRTDMPLPFLIHNNQWKNELFPDIDHQASVKLNSFFFFFFWLKWMICINQLVIKDEVLTESFKKYRSKVSESKIIQSSSKIGESKTTKFPMRVQPPFLIERTQFVFYFYFFLF